MRSKIVIHQFVHEKVVYIKFINCGNIVMFCVYKYLKICSKISFSMSGISIGLSLLSKGPYSIAKNTLLRLASI